MKKFFSFMMICALLFSMSMSAFATQGQGSITITNATKDDTYYLYKIFDATYGVKDNKEYVAYTIEKSNQFFTYLFGADGKTANTYFTYSESTGSVIRKEGYQDSTITNYLKEMVQEEGKTYTPVSVIEADSETVTFENLDYGYYVIDKGNGAAVTINSNTPNVSVVDKTQVPGSGFEKWIYDEDADAEAEQWVKSASSNIGDIVDFKVEFGATNYDGEYQVKYYTVTLISLNSTQRASPLVSFTV